MIRCGKWEAKVELKTVLRCLSWEHVWAVLPFTEPGTGRERAGISLGCGVVRLDNTFWLFFTLITNSIVYNIFGCRISEVEKVYV